MLGITIGFLVCYFVCILHCRLPIPFVLRDMTFGHRKFFFPYRFTFFSEIKSAKMDHITMLTLTRPNFQSNLKGVWTSVWQSSGNGTKLSPSSNNPFALGYITYLACCHSWWKSSHQVFYIPTNCKEITKRVHAPKI